MTKILIDRSTVEQALEAWDGGDTEWFKRAYTVMENIRAALVEPVTVDQRVVPLVESALQAVAETIGDQCAVWYGIGARDVEAVLREAARHGLVHGALAEPVQEQAEPDSPERRCGGPGCDGTCCQPVQEPVAWIEHEWAGTGLRKLHFEKRDPTVRDEVVNPVWTPLYTAPPQRKENT